MKGFMIAAPASGAGKTTVTLGLLRALKRRGEELAPVKVGPDYIDPAYHKAASGMDCFNLDPWAMRPELISALSSRMTESGARLLVAEGMMGLFDGAIDGKGSSADLARIIDLPVVLVVDCARQSHSIAALVWGFSQFRKDVLIAGIILNRVGSLRHEAMLRGALEPLGIPVLGALPAILLFPCRKGTWGWCRRASTPILRAFSNTLQIQWKRISIWTRCRRSGRDRSVTMRWPMFHA